MRQFKLLVLIVSVVSLLGCGESGPELGLVEGTITLEGEPVANASVSFMPLFSGGTQVSATTDESGFYSMQYSLERKGVMIGNHQVQISTAGDERDPITGAMTIIKESVPRWYWGPDSILEFDVQPGENDGSFELSKKKPKN